MTQTRREIMTGTASLALRLSFPSPANVHRAMTPLEWGMLVALSVLWGGSFFFTGIAVQELPPLTIVFLRVALAAVILLAVLNATGMRMPKARAGGGVELQPR